MPTYINGVDTGPSLEGCTDEALVLRIGNAAMHRDRHRTEHEGWQRNLDRLIAEAVRRGAYTLVIGPVSDPTRYTATSPDEDEGE